MQMTKYYPTDELVPGMVTAGEVRTKGGQLIVENGVSLTDRLISRIKFYAIPQVSVTEDPIPVTKKRGTDRRSHLCCKTGSPGTFLFAEGCPL